jgi:hypothetical protein
LHLTQGVFAEFGVGNGFENNTLALVAGGWSGLWAGAQELAFNPNPTQASALKFHFKQAWITRANIGELYRSGLAAIGREKCDLISVDLDGNDYYIIEALLADGAQPEVFLAEYNAKFIPPIRFRMEYNEDHQWLGDDYFGASLASYADLFARHDYFLACCNISGANAFFIKNKHKGAFQDVPAELELLFASPKYFLTGLDCSGHPLSVRTIESLFARLYAPD